MHTFYQPHDSEYQWIKDHPLEQVQGNPSKTVQTRQQLAIDPEICMFALTMSAAKPKNIKEAMANSAWIEAMQEELHQFDRLQVWELFDKPFGKTIIKLKWLWKNKKDEDQTMDVKTAFLNGLLKEENAPRAWYDELSKFLMSKGLTKGTINPTLFMIRYGEDILLVQIYVDDIIFRTSDPPIPTSVGTPMATKPKLDADLSGKLVDQTNYRSMIGSLMYLTSSRPDIVQAYLKDSCFELTAFSDADHAGCLEYSKSILLRNKPYLVDKLSQSSGCQEARLHCNVISRKLSRAR
ncbi:retrovirus-related pol polyprotein from transposon TNT 1-94 [Tanacetum coccineum]